eukprot:jgi/Psemu1/22187/gm1.22187_g
MTGNKKDKTKFVGKDLSLLVLCIVVHPQALLDEMAMFIYNKGGCTASNSFPIEGKHGSIQGLLPSEDEERILTEEEQTLGISFRRVRSIGNIPNHLSQIIARSQQWVWVRRVAGTTGDSFAPFVRTICSAVEDHGDEQRVFLWDNLIGSIQFNILPCLAYQPKYGPTKYVICKLVNHLKINTREPVDLDDIEQHIIQAAAAAAAAIGAFNSTSAHCGYSQDGTYPGINLPDPLQAPDWQFLGLPSNADPQQAPDWELLGLPGVELHG